MVCFTLIKNKSACQHCHLFRFSVCLSEINFCTLETLYDAEIQSFTVLCLHMTDQTLLGMPAAFLHKPPHTHTHDKIFQNVIMTFKMMLFLERNHTTVATLCLRNNLLQKVSDCCRALNIHTAGVSGDSVLLSLSLRLTFSTFAAI